MVSEDTCNGAKHPHIRMLVGRETQQGQKTNAANSYKFFNNE